MEQVFSTYDREMFKDTFENEFTWLNGFLRNVHRSADKPALTCPLRNRTWTYSELNGECNRVAGALLETGVRKNDLVMYQLQNCVEFIFLYIGLQKIGAVGCPINYRFAYGETAYVIDDSRPSIFFFDSDVQENAQKALGMARHRPGQVIMVDPFGKGKPSEGTPTFDQFVGGRSGADPEIERPMHIYDETTRLYTSGTSGMPKGVPINNINEVLSAHDVIMHFPLSPLDKTMNMTPWFHRGGLHSGGPNPTLYVGGEVVVMRQFNPRVCLDYVEKYGLTFLIGAPPMLKLLHDQQIRKGADLKKLKGIVTMGAPLEREACLSYHKVLTQNIFNGYGSSEAFWNTFLRPWDLPERAGSAGRACTDDDVAVVKIFKNRRAEPHEHVAKDGHDVGEIIVKAPAKTTYSYHNNPEDCERNFYKGWLYIGDLGAWDKDEYVTVVGRKYDMIISAGENIHPVQVESVINEHPKVRECIVVGVPDEVRGEAVAAYVIREDPSLTVRELSEHCNNHPMLSKFKRPRYYRFADELPYTATGKKMHYKVREQVAEDKEKGLLERASAV
jgi:acyl-coenzyme A synthetase/AMP-(fatty) acid ligase